MHDPDFDPYLPPRAPVGYSKTHSQGTVGIDGNPWLTVWTQPRATIRGIVDSDPSKGVLLLSIIYGVNSTMNQAMQRNTGDTLSMPVLLAMFVIGGIISGLIGNLLMGALLLWTGRWLGGRANYRETRAALAWASVPQAVNLMLMIGLTIVFGHEIYQSVDPEQNPMMGIALIVVGIAQVILVVWSIVLMVKCLAEVHKFSAWRGLSAVLLLIPIFIGLIAIIVVAVMVAGVVAGLGR